MSRNVLFWVNEGVGEEIHFRCPCGERMVYVTSPPHTISFDDEGLLTLVGSVGSRASLHLSDGKPNWCHFWLKNGIPKMCFDTRCPGGSK